MKKHEFFSLFIKRIPPGSIFVEVGGERGEGSTAYLALLAKLFSTKLISVDIEPRDFPTETMRKSWQIFYTAVRGPDWPKNTFSIDELSDDLRNECLHVHNWLDIEQKVIANFRKPDNVVYVCERGSSWTKDYGKNYQESISLLYLDNFDYIWDIDKIPDWIRDQIDQYANHFKIEMNNQNCQVEHLAQLMNLYPFLTDDCLIGFDDTYLHNDCWIGKSGPGVVFLLADGWKIVYKSGNFVIMGRSCGSSKFGE